jgi:hypothetical protein
MSEIDRTSTDNDEHDNSDYFCDGCGQSIRGRECVVISNSQISGVVLCLECAEEDGG